MSLRKLVVACTILLVCGLAVTANAQPPNQGGAGGPRFFGGAGGGSGLDMLRGDDVRKELQLVDDQISKLEALQEKSREQMQQFFQGGFQNFRDLSEEERRAQFAKIQETMQKQNEETQKEVDAILLPHQTKRLKQLTTQRRLRAGGSTNVMSADQVAELLSLTDAQKAELKEKAEQIQKELRDKLAELRKDAEADLLSVLTPEQRIQLKDMVGEPFEFQQQQFGGGRGRGGAGGAGAQPGGGDRRRPGGRTPQE